MREVYVKGAEFESAGEVHGFLARELGFPAYYGGNLDALFDVLTDISRPVRIILEMTGVKEERMREFFRRMAQVMEDAAGENPCLEVERR